MANTWDNGTDPSQGLWGNDRAARDQAWSDVGLNPSGRYPGFDMGKRGVVGLMPGIGMQVGFANEMEPIREQMIRNFITQNNPNNQNYLIDAARRNALSQASAGQQQLLANGYGGAYTDPGAAVQAGNQAGSNAFTMVHSPDYQNALYSNVLGAVNQGQNISLLPAAEAFHGMTLSTPRNQSGLQAIGGLLGNAMGMLGGGGGGLMGMLGGGAGAGMGVGSGIGGGMTDWMNNMGGMDTGLNALGGGILGTGGF